MKSPLKSAFLANSPRASTITTPLASWLIHGAVLGLGIALVITSFFAVGVWGWTIGLVYVIYDTCLQAFTVYSTWQLMRPQAALPEVSVSSSLGILVAAHNEAKVLPATLKALFAQANPNDVIVIADDGSTDDTDQLLTTTYGLTAAPKGELSQPSALYPQLRWLKVPHGGKARALNAALVLLETDNILTVDADTLLQPRALNAIRHAFSVDANLVAATGVIRPICGTSLHARILEGFQTYEYMRNFLSRFAWMGVNGLLLISGAFAAFKRDAVIEVGGFDADSLVEDYELIHRLRRFSSNHQRGWTTAVVGQAQASTEAPSSVGAFIRQRRRWFGGFLQTQLWYRDMVGSAHYGNVGTRMLPVKAVDTLQPIFGLAALTVFGVALISGRFNVVWPVLIIVGIKIVFDILMHGWFAFIYRRWIGEESGVNIGGALFAALVEPFSFQFLRHISATSGWFVFLTGKMRWGRQKRLAVH